MTSQLTTHRLSRRALLASAVAAAGLVALPSRKGSTQAANLLAWEEVVPRDGVAPAPRWDHALAADEAGSRLMLFGGRDGSGTALGDTWIFDAATSTWTQLGGDAPSPRFGVAAAVDRSGGGLYLFGGQSADLFFNDTWRFDFGSSAWTLVDDGTGIAPSPRYGLGAAIDGARRVIISHGFTSEGRFDDTWAFDLAAGGWTDISPVETARPLRRCLHEQVWDETTGRMLLYAGCSSGYGPCPQGDLWTFDPVAGLWTEVTPAAGPEARSNPAVVSVPGRAATMLFGGLSTAGYLADAWLLSVTENTYGWSGVEQRGPAPGPRASHDLVAVREDVYLFGGAGPDDTLGDLWRGRLSVPD